jgi:hypothetical protein
MSGSAADALSAAYGKLKRLVADRFAGNASAEVALLEHAADPETWRAPLAMALQDTGAGVDEAVIVAAQELMLLLDALGARAGKYEVDVRGAQGVQVGDGNQQFNVYDSAPGTGHEGEAAGELARIENDREHDRMRPVLEGRIVAGPSYSDGRDHRLEIRVKTHWPLALILLNVPGDAWFTSSVHMPPVGMSFLIQFPEPGRTSAPFRPSHPASCPVRIAASARGTVTAFAECRNEYGRVWEDIEVTIRLDGSMLGNSPDAAPGTNSGRS